MLMMSTFIVFILALLAAAVTWGYASYQRDMRASRQKSAGRSRVIQTASGPVEYAAAGEGPVVLVSHGAGGGFDQGLDIAGPLAQRGFRVIAVSRFGYLRTPSPANVSAAAQADAYADLLDSLGIARVAILGASAGGPSAMQFAIRHPRRCDALILLVPLAYRPPNDTRSAPAMSPSMSPSMSPWAEKILMTIVGSDLVFWLAAKFARNMVIKRVLGTPPEVVALASEREQARINNTLEMIRPISGRIGGIINDGHISASLTRFALEKIIVPTLVISACDDGYGTFAGADYTAKSIPGARFIGFPTGGHLLVGHQSEVFDEVVLLLHSAGSAAARKSMVENIRKGRRSFCRAALQSLPGFN